MKVIVGQSLCRRVASPRRKDPDPSLAHNGTSALPHYELSEQLYHHPASINGYSVTKGRVRWRSRRKFLALADDCWYLWHNLSDSVQRAVAKHRRCLHTPTSPGSGSLAGPSQRDGDRPAPGTTSQRTGPIGEQTQTNCSSTTAPAGGSACWRTYEPHLHQRRRDGCTDATGVWREIHARGYTGGYSRVRDQKGGS